jgi:pantothenate synthetase
LYRALSAVAAAVESGVTDPAQALAAGEPLLEAPLGWEYLAIVDPRTFAEPETVERPALVVAVVRAGTTRLLDNLPIATADGVDPVLTPPRPLRQPVTTRGLP